MIRANKPIYKVTFLEQKRFFDDYAEEKVRYIQADDERQAINRFLKWADGEGVRHLITYKSCEKLEVDHA